MSNVNNMSLVEVMKTLNEKYGARFILPLEEDKPIFTPERLLGVETLIGFVDGIYNGGFLVSINGINGYYTSALKIYISDDSDETVSFDDYVKLFYNTENT